MADGSTVAAPLPGGSARPGHLTAWGLTRTTWVTLAVFAVLAAFYIAVLSAAQAYYSPAAPPLSTYGTDPAGMAALYRYLARIGVNEARLEQFDVLPPAAGTVIVEAGAPARSLTTGRLERLKRWVESGGTLVIAAQDPSPLHDIAGIRPTGVDGPGMVDVSPSGASRLVGGVATAEISGARYLSPLPSAATVELAAAGRPVLVSRPIGSGTVIVLADQYALSNGGIAVKDNLALALDVVAPRGAATIVFDEYHHGYASGSGAFDVLPVAVRLSIVELVIAAAALLFARGRRLGTPRPVTDEQPRSPLEYVRSLAGLFRHAGAARQSADILKLGFERELVARFGPAMRDPRFAADVLKKRGLSKAALAHTWPSNVMDDRGLLALAKAIAAGRQEVAGADRRSRGAG